MIFFVVVFFFFLWVVLETVNSIFWAGREYWAEIVGFSDTVLLVIKVALSVATQCEKLAVFQKVSPFCSCWAMAELFSIESKLNWQWWRTEKDTPSCNSSHAQKLAHKALYLVSAVNDQIHSVGFKKKKISPVTQCWTQLLSGSQSTMTFKVRHKDVRIITHTHFQTRLTQVCFQVFKFSPIPNGKVPFQKTSTHTMYFFFCFHT